MWYGRVDRAAKPNLYPATDHAMTRPILPGATLGMLGGGQLGRMFALAARRMGYRIHVLADAPHSPCDQVADREIVGRYDDVDAVAELARGVAVVTFEFENVCATAAAMAERHAPLRPGANLLHVTQHRIREKTFVRDAGVPVTPFEPVRSRDELHAAVGRIGLPAVLKTATSGYDGKGQVLLRSPADVDSAWHAARTHEAVLERFIAFERELSVIVARGVGSACAFYGPFDNAHANHILDVSSAPAGIPESVRRDAVQIARTLAERFDLVGLLCVELFLTPDGTLYVNELAPRTHNSGHLTIEACVTSQFEQHVRAVCGLPLGDAALIRPAAMANLLGDLWQAGEPDWSAALAQPETKLHLYGKPAARPGRKMGHITALADSPAAARVHVLAARDALTAERP